MSNWIHIVVLIIQPLSSDASVLYVSEETTTADGAASTCNLATPDIQFGNAKIFVSLDGPDKNIDIRESVWNGYVQTYSTFLYEGCCEGKFANSSIIYSNMFKDPGECFSKCQTDVIGMQKTTCHCNPFPGDLKKYAYGCGSPCSIPADTVCGGNKAISIYRKVKYPVSRDGEEAEEDTNCRALFWKNDGKHFYSWRKCSTPYPGMCGIGDTSSKFEYYSASKDWTQSAGQCLEKQQRPAKELVSAFPDLIISDTFDNLIWIGQIRSRVILKDLDQTIRTPGWRRGYITKKEKNFVLQFNKAPTMMKSLCEKASSSVSTMQSMHPTAPSPTTNPEENRNRSNQKAKLDNDPQFPMIAVYVGVPFILVIIVVVVILILCKRRKHAPGKKDDPKISQENAHTIPRSRNAVSNASYQDCDVRHEYFTLEPVNDYAVVSDIETNASINDEYDTITNLRAKTNDTAHETDNVYNKLDDLTDDTYNHTNTAAASVEKKKANDTSNDTDNVYNKLEDVTDDTYSHTQTADASVQNTYNKATYDKQEPTYNTAGVPTGSRTGTNKVNDSEYSTLDSSGGT